ncbi:SCO family protein [Polaribacter undariae]|uniref:SCO family protein n=2 Tax=Polaribacter sejongensis TaxID=985043 RepID=A0AAJ1QV87_9FLAO|nr:MULTISPECIES: SCO family protein [Polaribacter]MDN3618667.1 SCO family protein [Polaribacter undariae]UWD30354.1 SCO family protein [Polaribacter undariae]
MFSKNTLFFSFLTVFILLSCVSSEVKLPIINKAFLEDKNISEIESMSFRNQFNKEFSVTSLKGKVHLVNFFFVSCTTICPIMAHNLKDVVLGNNNIDLLSFTIDPENDSISVLKKYHKNVAENVPNWTFLRGNKKDLRNIAKLYLSYITNNGSDDSYFYHSSSVVLLDKKMRIRGVYDSLDKEEIALLERDIKILSKK